MNRLTERDEFGNADIIGVDSADLQLNLDFDDLNLVTDALNRLAAYEDTGLSPGELKAKCAWADKMCKTLSDIFGDSGVFDFSHFKELSKAEQDGRLVVLPCKVGDVVWFNTYKNNATECVGIQPHEVKRVNIYFVTDGADIPQWDIGKTVFLTREEAEKALKGVSEDARY